MRFLKQKKFSHSARKYLFFRDLFPHVHYLILRADLYFRIRLIHTTNLTNWYPLCTLYHFWQKRDPKTLFMPKINEKWNGMELYAGALCLFACTYGTQVPRRGAFRPDIRLAPGRPRQFSRRGLSILYKIT